VYVDNEYERNDTAIFAHLLPFVQEFGSRRVRVVVDVIRN
jgi:hypothetical protein